MARTALSALGARWSGGSITMGPAGRDRRMRLVKASCVAPSGKHLVVAEQRTVPAKWKLLRWWRIQSLLQSLLPPVEGPLCPTETRDRPCSPGRKRGRVGTSGRTQLGSRLSRAERYTASLNQLVWFLVNFGFLAGTGGCKC